MARVKETPSISAVVRKIAEDWRDEYVRGKNGGTRTITRLVHKILHEGIEDIIFSIIGVKRDSFGRYEMIKSIDKEETIVEIMRRRYEQEIIEQLEQLGLFKSISLSQKDLEQLKRSFKESLMDSLREHVTEKATQAAEEIAEEQLRHIWVDEDVVAFMHRALSKE